MGNYYFIRDMKFAVITALFAVVAAEECDPTKMTYKFYDDKECTTENTELTGKYGTPEEARDFAHYKDECQVEGEYSYKFMCDKDGFHDSIWENKECKDETLSKLDFKWDKCGQLA